MKYLMDTYEIIVVNCREIILLYHEHKYYKGRGNSLIDNTEIVQFHTWGIFIWDTARGGALNFFSGRGVQPGFPKCGACELTFASEKGGLWAENFQIWGLVSWKFPNFGVCELKISKFGGLWAKIWMKIEAAEAKISKFSQKGSCELTLLLEMGPLWAAGEAWKGGLQGRTSPYPLSRSVPPRDTAYFFVILWSMTLCFIELQWNMLYSMWKCLT